MFGNPMTVDLSEYLKYLDIVDNLLSNSDNKVLSANQGRVLKSLVDDKYTIVGGKVEGDNLVLNTSTGNALLIDVRPLLVDIKSISGSYDQATQSLVITLSDTSSFSIPVASLLPVTTNTTLKGDGSGTPLGVALSTDIDNALAIGNDGALYVKKELLSTKPTNALVRDAQGKLLVQLLDDEDLSNVASNTAVSSRALQLYVDNGLAELKKARYFLSTDTFTPADSSNPTEAEVKNKVTQRGVIAYYNGTNNADTKATHSWYLDKNKNIVTLLGSASALPIVHTPHSEPNEDEYKNFLISEYYLRDRITFHNREYNFSQINNNFSPDDSLLILDFMGGQIDTLNEDVPDTLIANFYGITQGIPHNDFEAGFRLTSKCEGCSDFTLVKDFGTGSVYGRDGYGTTVSPLIAPVLGTIELDMDKGTQYNLHMYIVKGEIDEHIRGSVSLTAITQKRSLNA